jgi:DNA uptake protein ComE-like DNA-binding protein
VRTDRRREGLRSWWLVFAFNPFWTAWVAFVYIGLRAKRPRWVGWGVVYGVVAVVSVVLLDRPGALEDIAVAGTFGGWLVALVHALVVRDEYLERLDVLEDPRLKTTRLLQRRRELVTEIAREHPRLAEESGVGRPDVKDAFDGGLVDLNHASERALAALPGVDKRLAHQIVLIRGRIGGFSSLYDAGSLLDLEPGVVDDLRDRIVCLPL